MDAHKIREILLGAIIGDALGTPFDGLAKGHLAAVYGRIDLYADPEPALRHHMENWKKPALYSSLSQFMLIMAMSIKENRRNPAGTILSHLERAMSAGNRENGIFRHAGKAESMLLARLGNPEMKHDIRPPSTLCARIPVMAAVASAAAWSLSPPELLAITGIFSTHTDTAAAALILNKVLVSVPDGADPAAVHLPDIALQAAAGLRTCFEKNPASAFNAGVNPDSLVESLGRYGTVLSALIDVRDRDGAERAIIPHVNATLKTPVTRATINNPLCLLPFSMFLASSAADTAGALCSAAMEGGSTTPLCAMTGALSGALRGTDGAAEFLAGLINRKRICALVDGIARGGPHASAVREFIEAETPLTAKEDGERMALLKHVPVKQKTKPTRKEIEEKFARHVVESWTKLDRARWKKEKKKLDRDE